MPSFVLEGNGTLGLLGMPADVKADPAFAQGAAQPRHRYPERADWPQIRRIRHAEHFGYDGLDADRPPERSAWAPPICLVTLTLTALMLFRNALVAILSVVGLYHISNLLFDFSLPG